MHYRREIDGLRAIAVLPVILFHAGFPAFSGGFVGVDVFFVISGFLITSIILAEKERGTFSLIDFYERRARRILPALFVVMLACIPFAWFWLVPGDMREFSRSLVAVSAFSSNFLFWQESDYFSTAAELKPLLHTWSLAVEEQYYVLYPLFLMLMWKLGRQWLLPSLVAIAFVSLALAQWGSFNQPMATFFLLPTRGWELAAGAFAAFYILSKRGAEETTAGSGTAREILGLLGLLMIGYSVFAFDETVPFPSLYTLYPTVGATLIILYTSPQTVAGRVLGSKTLVGIGLISYSAYLWHQPVFAFARHRGLSESNGAMFILLAAGAIGLAYLSWRFVELPFRQKGRINRQTIFACVAGGLVCFAGIGMYGQYNDNSKLWLSALNQDQQRIYQYTDRSLDLTDLYLYQSCFLFGYFKAPDTEDVCNLTTSPDTSILVWGDSHGAALFNGLKREHDNIAHYATPGCAPLLDYSASAHRPYCKSNNRYVIGRIGKIRPAVVILHANWWLVWNKNQQHLIERTVAAIHSLSPGTRVVVVGGVPQWIPSLPVQMLMQKIPLSAESRITTDLDEIAAVDRELQNMSGKPGFRFLPLIPRLCELDQCPAVSADDDVLEPFAWDYAHLTAGGSRMVAAIILDRIFKTR